MKEFLEVFSSVSYVLFIVSSIMLGVSFAVKTLVVSTIKKINAESSKNFDKIEDNKLKSGLKAVFKKTELRYAYYCDKALKIKKTARKNKVRSFFRLVPLEIEDNSGEFKDIFLSLIKEISVLVNGDGGYLNFSKNELFSMLKTLLLRLKILIDSLDIIWLKSVKIPFIIQVLKGYTELEKFKGKTLVIIVTGLLNFTFSVTRFFSPVGATKNLMNATYSENFSKTLAKAIIEVVGNEWAYLCFEKRKLSITKQVKVNVK